MVGDFQYRRGQFASVLRGEPAFCAPGKIAPEKRVFPACADRSGTERGMIVGGARIRVEIAAEVRPWLGVHPEKTHAESRSLGSSQHAHSSGSEPARIHPEGILFYWMTRKHAFQASGMIGIGMGEEQRADGACTLALERNGRRGGISSATRRCPRIDQHGSSSWCAPEQRIALAHIEQGESRGEWQEGRHACQRQRRHRPGNFIFLSQPKPKSCSRPGKQSHFPRLQPMSGEGEFIDALRPGQRDLRRLFRYREQEPPYFSRW